MRKLILPFILSLVVFGCSDNSKASNTGDMTDSITEETDSIFPDRSLNDIRFENWTESDWLDNDYIRTLRSYLDDVVNGTNEVNDDILPYKDKLSGKFVIADLGPHLLGGLDISIIFPDMPDLIFNSWVYGYVDEETETVTGYSVRWFNLMDERSGMTKQEILEEVEKHPELKLW